MRLMPQQDDVPVRLLNTCMVGDLKNTYLEAKKGAKSTIR